MASIIKADNIQKVSDGTNIIKKCGSTITLGSCGATISLACGATQTGFGRTGTVDWCTTAKTAPFTGVSGKGYFVNTTCGAVTVTLPASPSAGDIISIADYASTFQTNNLTICRNSSKINGGCNNANLNTQGQSITLVYVDATRGWKNTMDSTSNVTGQPNFIVATGGTISCCGDYKIHTFTSDGCFSITTAPTPANNNVSYMVVAGGGGGATSSNGNSGGGGGAGGFREGKVSGDPYIASPLAAATGIPVSITSYPITVGGGGASVTASPFQGINGSVSVFSTITSAGGGGAGSGFSPASPTSTGLAGGSGGGGGGGSNVSSNPGGAGNTPPVSPPQGNPGGGARPGPGPASDTASGGGGGAGGPGSNSPNGANGGAGGAHVNSSITGSDLEYAGGSGGSGIPGCRGTPGGGGAGQSEPSSSAGTSNTGGGGGGAYSCASGKAGGSGVVIIRYKYQ
jgi:hypothetical protein